MPYYSVRFADGPDTDAAGREAREMLGGIAPDRTGHSNMFYVRKPYKIDQLRQNLSSFDEDYEVDVKRITKREYEWNRHGR